ncbi:MAG: tyrosine-type recombinase/integrase [Bifidobacteriaceae bacterium]|jgi:integrase|nr:tyrosine-type recombinase/integrase [Bifidobacteriaceae bacterium]
MLGLAVRFDIIPANPLREVTRIVAKKSEVKALDATQVRLLRQQLSQDVKAIRGDLPDVIGLMLATGGRVGEVIAVRWQDVDLDAGTVAITGKIIRRGSDGLVREDTTKGHKTTKLTLPEWAVAMLKDRAAKHLPGGPMGLVFPTANAGPREVRTIEHQWMMFRHRHPEWRDVTAHRFRKTVGTATAEALGAEAAATQLAHSNPELTRQRYIAKPNQGPDIRQAPGGFALPPSRPPTSAGWACPMRSRPREGRRLRSAAA